MSDSWPACATEPIAVVPPDPTWQSQAADLIVSLRPLLEPWLDGDIEHVGSTAVPGLAAKPVLDLLAPVTALEECDAAVEPLADAGWELVPPELDGRPWRRLYVLPDGARRVAHLHLVERAHEHWHATVTFRDRLRQHPELVAEYAELKRRLAEASTDDREAYTDGKTDFVRRVVGGA
jgi:GrpB-like predicted nucleotidyltransferase (UPF0157 family)